MAIPAIGRWESLRVTLIGYTLIEAQDLPEPASLAPKRRGENKLEKTLENQGPNLTPSEAGAKLRQEKRQSIGNKKGEILFRRELYRQYVDGETVRGDEFSRDQFIEIMKSTVKQSDRDFSKLRRQVTLSPFLEIGAWNCQRSMLLVDKYGGSGFAIDISFDGLKTADFLSTHLKMRLPIRICCNAYNLPFRNNSFPFIFCYGTLHHFPDPSPILREIKRVLGAGYFYFDEEPVKQTLKVKLNLYRKKNKTCTRERHRALFLVRVLKRFIQLPSYPEAEFGKIENSDISISDWQKALSIFDKRDVTLHCPTKGGIHFLSCNLDTPRISVKRMLVWLLGGNISGLCFVKKDGIPDDNGNIFALIGCPNCLEINGCDISKCRSECQDACKSDAISIEHGEATISDDKCNLCSECLYTCPLGAINKPQLAKRGENLFCKGCGREYMKKDGILVLFSEKQEKELSPELVCGTRAA